MDFRGKTERGRRNGEDLRKCSKNETRNDQWNFRVHSQILAKKTRCWLICAVGEQGFLVKI